MTASDAILGKIIGHLQPVVAPGIEIHAESRIIADLGLDSLVVMNFVMALEDDFDVSLTMDDLAKVETVADLAKTLENLIGKVGG